MPDLNTLLTELNIPVAGESCPPGLPVEAVTDDSRRCVPGMLFVAIAGAQADGHDYLKQAAGRGAAAALVGRAVAAPPLGLPLIRVEDPRRAIARLAQRLAGDPSHAMTVVGVTGTNGKTTVTYLLESIFHAAGHRTGVMGTVNYRWDGRAAQEPSAQTTPSPTDLAAYLAQMRAAGVQSVAMEVSSHAIDQRRIDGIRFAAAAFTNLTQDHLDYHTTMADYAKAKERLFTELLAENPGSVAVLNLDDPIGRRYALLTGARNILGYSAAGRSPAHLCLRSARTDAAGMTLEVQALGRALTLQTPLIGGFNIENCLAAAATALAVGVAPEAIAAGIAATSGAPGRCEAVRAGQSFPVLVDYAHTPDSLEKILANLRPLASGRLIVVFGAGGDRDPTKRRPMGQAAARWADEIIVTNDNPRTEDPERIAAMVIEGIEAGLRKGKHWHKQLDRRTAIGEAIAMAGPADVVVIAGKGHEDYQILGSGKIHFDDRETARAAIEALRDTNPPDKEAKS